VAVSLANYGIPVEFVTRLPENEIADWCFGPICENTMLALLMYYVGGTGLAYIFWKPVL